MTNVFQLYHKAQIAEREKQVDQLMKQHYKKQTFAFQLYKTCKPLLKAIREQENYENAPDEMQNHFYDKGVKIILTEYSKLQNRLKRGNKDDEHDDDDPNDYFRDDDSDEDDEDDDFGRDDDSDNQTNNDSNKNKKKKSKKSKKSNQSTKTRKKPLNPLEIHQVQSFYILMLTSHLIRLYIYIYRVKWNHTDNTNIQNQKQIKVCNNKC